eukprot:1681650-Pleurochrysis_carterae.AAC.1
MLARLCDEGLAASGGPVEQDTLGGLHAVPLVLGGELKRVLQRLRHLALHVEKAADVLQGDAAAGRAAGCVR